MSANWVIHRKPTQKDANRDGQVWAADIGFTAYDLIPFRHPWKPINNTCKVYPSLRYETFELKYQGHTMLLELSNTVQDQQTKQIIAGLFEQVSS